MHPRPGTPFHYHCKTSTKLKMSPQSSAHLQNRNSTERAAVVSQKEVMLQKPVKYVSEADNYTVVTQLARACVVFCVCLLVYFRSIVQDYIDNIWIYLKESPFFCSAYFETVYVTATYAVVMILYPYAMHYIPFLQRFKVSEDVTYVHRTLFGRTGLLLELVTYMSTYLLADSLKMKKYYDVPESEWEKRRAQWIQTTRALPEESPNVLVLCVQVVGAIFTFDMFFFFIHLMLHKNMFLYKYIHSQHHDHDVMHPHVTNQLSVVERILQVASANYALIFLRCHPLTRVAFVPFYIWFLIENHTGFDLPWAPHRLVPHGVMGGPAKHHNHHLCGSRHYQPFFNYLDHLLERRRALNQTTKRHLSSSL